MPRRYAYWILLALTSGLYYELAGLIKHHLESWLSMPDPSGEQYSQTLPPVPPWVGLLAVSFGGALGAFGACVVGEEGRTRGVYVNLSRANATTSIHVSVVPYKVTLVLRTCSKSCYIE
jgi:hypothetical protein